MQMLQCVEKKSLSRVQIAKPTAFKMENPLHLLASMQLHRLTRPSSNWVEFIEAIRRCDGVSFQQNARMIH